MNTLYTLRAAVLASAVLAFSSPAFGQRQGNHAKTAVIEFSPAPQVAPLMIHESKRYLQASIAKQMVDTMKFHIVDVRHTRQASQSNLAEVNDEKSTAAAVKVGKQLGVVYVLTGAVTEYDPKGAGGMGRAVLRARLVDVATGQVKYSGEFAQSGLRRMQGGSTVEMQANVLKPAIVKMVGEIAGKL